MARLAASGGAVRLSKVTSTRPHRSVLAGAHRQAGKRQGISMLLPPAGRRPPRVPVRMLKYGRARQRSACRFERVPRRRQGCSAVLGPSARRVPEGRYKTKKYREDHDAEMRLCRCRWRTRRYRPRGRHHGPTSDCRRREVTASVYSWTIRLGGTSCARGGGSSGSGASTCYLKPCPTSGVGR